MVLAGYKSNDNRLRIWEKRDCMVFHTDLKNIYHRLLPLIHHVSEPKTYGINDCESFYLCLYFEEGHKN